MVKKIIIVVAVILLILGIYWFLFIKKINRTEVKRLISVQSAKYNDPTGVEKVLLKGVREIEESPKAIKQAWAYSKTSSVPIEQVLVDNAIAMAKQYKYID